MNEIEAIKRLSTCTDLELLISEIYAEHRAELQKTAETYQVSILESNAKHKQNLKVLALEFIEMISKIKEGLKWHLADG